MPVLIARPGFSLIEVSLALSVGLMLIAGSVLAYNQINQSSRIQNAKTMVGIIQGNIGMEKFRLGVPPPFTPRPSVSPAQGVSLNRDSTGKQYAPQGTSTSLPVDPVRLVNTLYNFDSEASPVPLSAGAPTPEWDNPIFLSPSPSVAPGYGNGGWLYDERTGAFRANLSNADYPDQRPANW